MGTDEKLIEVKNLKKYYHPKSSFSKKKQPVKAVDDVSFFIRKGETFGVVGESGCGKTTLGRTVIDMIRATDGEIFFEGENILVQKKNQLDEIHKKMQIIFQDPYSSLDPTMSVYKLISEPLTVDESYTKEKKYERVKSLLEQVGLSENDMNKNAYEFSGGQRQRIGIARALANNPEFIMCDEPISALDVSIQAQIINLLEDCQQEFGLTYLFIAHDISVVHHFCDRIAVMYLGKIVEIGTADEIYYSSKHPYTQALLSAIPIADPEEAKKKARTVLKGDPPSPMHIPGGCRFHTRCNQAMEICKTVSPEEMQLSPEHGVFCHLYDESKI